MSGLHDGLRATMADWGFTPAEANDALGDFLAALKAAPEETVRAIIAEELSHGKLREARRILAVAERDIKKCMPDSAARMKARRKANAEYQRRHYQARKAEALLARSINKGE